MQFLWKFLNMAKKVIKKMDVNHGTLCWTVETVEFMGGYKT